MSKPQKDNCILPSIGYGDAFFSSKLAAKVLLLCVASALLFGHSAASASCTNCAKNRIDVLSVIDGLNSSWQGAETTVWINGNEPEPAVTVGDKLYYTMKSNEDGFFALILVDTKGHTSVLKPDAVAGNAYSDPSSYSVFPPLTDNCFVYEPREECFDKKNIIIQGDTIGKETVYLLTSKQPIENDIFMVPARSDYTSIGKDLDLLGRLVDGISTEMLTNQISISKYSYNVDSPDVQYGSRAIGRIVVDLEELASNEPPAERPEPVLTVQNQEPVAAVENPEPVAAVEGIEVTETAPAKVVKRAAPALVFNNITFGHDSAEITIEGGRELAALGSVLVDRLELGKLPFVSLTGHTDSSGSASYNLDLSGQRARSVKRYLVTEWGLPASQIFADGAGESLPVASNNTASGRSQNRRVEFSVISTAE